ncbi:hypothetical protein HRV96_14995 [Raoultella ornithinolytica]|uniref:hypothetical protein n=1 Tax=Raoultella ornithinolytica TaxID=54291 RepID=UPI001F32EDE5|nr:hypothetical protein [Raoultella ornithinolytica]UIZ74496.1 hypothetical protein HRV96_14995 [Raoultella ornithinolytica]
MANNDEPTVFQVGVNTITEYPDGKRVIEQNGHKMTQYPDGTMVAEMNGGHKAVISSSGTALTLHYASIKYAYPQNIANVVSVNTITNVSGMTKEITFTNGGTASCSYGPLGDLVSITTKNVNSFRLNKDGDEISFDISDSSSNLTVH